MRGAGAHVAAVTGWARGRTGARSRLRARQACWGDEERTSAEGRRGQALKAGSHAWGISGIGYPSRIER